VSGISATSPSPVPIGEAIKTPLLSGAWQIWGPVHAVLMTQLLVSFAVSTLTVNLLHQGNTNDTCPSYSDDNGIPYVYPLSSILDFLTVVGEQTRHSNLWMYPRFIIFSPCCHTRCIANLVLVLTYRILWLHGFFSVYHNHWLDLYTTCAVEIGPAMSRYRVNSTQSLRAQLRRRHCLLSCKSKMHSPAS
jgi:hypothetical protein